MDGPNGPKLKLLPTVPRLRSPRPGLPLPRPRWSRLGRPWSCVSSASFAVDDTDRRTCAGPGRGGFGVGLHQLHGRPEQHCHVDAAPAGMADAGYGCSDGAMTEADP